MIVAHEVIQADRDAATDLCKELGYGATMRRLTRTGKNDGSRFVQAFAAHRIAALSGISEVVEALEEARPFIVDLSARVAEYPGDRDEADQALAVLHRIDAALSRYREGEKL